MTDTGETDGRDWKFPYSIVVQTAMVWLLAFAIREGTDIHTNYIYDGVMNIIAAICMFFLLYVGCNLALGLHDIYKERYA